MGWRRLIGRKRFLRLRRIVKNDVKFDRIFEKESLKRLEFEKGKKGCTIREG